MSVTSNRNVQINFSGDVVSNLIKSALANALSPAVIEVIDLGTGTNVISPPDSTGLVITGVTIIPPAGNLTNILIKGVAGDVGIPIHLTDPTSIGLGTGFALLNLYTDDDVEGLRLIWT